MRTHFLNYLWACWLISAMACYGQISGTGDLPGTGLRLVAYETVTTGARQTQLYFPALAGKSIAVACNHTSLIGSVHLVDSLVNHGFSVKAIFGPEHGFRGDAGAGSEVKDGADRSTGIPIISLYGKKKKPNPGDLEGIDLVVFDMQDVGVRFYTYISTLTLVMEACAEKGIPLIVLDRPNPNGFYIDGPVLDTMFRSFVGMHPVPVVYGMTIGEYAMMVNGEGWLSGNVRCNLTVVPLKDWDRQMIVELPVSPSPNLPTWQSVYLYPSLCLFEGTVMSVGRGTDYPFECFGHPGLKSGEFAFTPRHIAGVAEKPPFEGDTCYGSMVRGFAENFKSNPYHFHLGYLLSAYRDMNLGEKFFNNYFEKLAGTKALKAAIMEGAPELDIRAGLFWNDLYQFNKTRKKYLLYTDFD